MASELHSLRQSLLQFQSMTEVKSEAPVERKINLSGMYCRQQAFQLNLYLVQSTIQRPSPRQCCENQLLGNGRFTLPFQKEPANQSAVFRNPSPFSTKMYFLGSDWMLVNHLMMEFRLNRWLLTALSAIKLNRLARIQYLYLYSSI